LMPSRWSVATTIEALLPCIEEQPIADNLLGDAVMQSGGGDSPLKLLKGVFHAYQPDAEAADRPIAGQQLTPGHHRERVGYDERRLPSATDADRCADEAADQVAPVHK
jgi:hypothetical protein